MRLHANFLKGTLSATLTAGGTTMQSDVLLDFPDVVSPDYMVVTLDPAAASGDPEIVYITAHTGGATPSDTATVLRAQEGTVAREHLVTSTRIVHAVTGFDFDGPSWDDVIADISGDEATPTRLVHSYDFTVASGNILDLVGTEDLVAAVSTGVITYQVDSPFGPASAVQFSRPSNAAAAAMGDWPVGATPRTIICVARSANDQMEDDENLWGYGNTAVDDASFFYNQTTLMPGFTGWGASADFGMESHSPLDGAWHIHILRRSLDTQTIQQDTHSASKTRVLDTGTTLFPIIPQDNTVSLVVAKWLVFDIAIEHDDISRLVAAFERLKRENLASTPQSGMQAISELATSDAVFNLYDFQDGIGDRSGHGHSHSQNFTPPAADFGDATPNLGRYLQGTNLDTITAMDTTDGNYSIELAFKHATLGNQLFICASRASSGADRPWQITANTDGSVQTASNIPSPTVLNTPTTVDDDEWHHLIWTKDWSSGDENLWLDGTHLEVDVAGNTVNPTFSIQSIFGVDYGTLGEYTGKLAFYAYYDYVLTDAQCQNHSTVAGF